MMASRLLFFNLVSIGWAVCQGFKGEFMKSMIAIILGLGLGLCSASSFAGTQQNLALGKECSKSIAYAAQIQFAEDAKIDISKVDEMARMYDPYLEEGSADNVVTVDFHSQDIYEWDGYASYKITVDPKPSRCQILKVELTGSEGL